MAKKYQIQVSERELWAIYKALDYVLPFIYAQSPKSHKRYRIYALHAIETIHKLGLCKVKDCPYDKWKALNKKK